MKRRETDIGTLAVAYFDERGFATYKEVDTHWGRPDIVAVFGTFVVVVECKTALTFDVIAQAHRFRHCAHHLYIAVPYSQRNSVGRALAYQVCEDRGIGVLECRRNDVFAKAAPSLCRRADTAAMTRFLREEQRTLVGAGSSRGGYWTPFRETCNQITRFVRDNDGCELKALIPGINHHYGKDYTAARCLTKWIEGGKVPAVRLAREGRSIRFYFVQPQDRPLPEGLRRKASGIEAAP